MASSYTISAFSYSTRKIQPTKQHLVKTTAVIGKSVIENYNGTIIHISDLPTEIEAAVRSAIDEQGYWTNTRPDDVIAYIDQFDYVRCDDCHHAQGINYYALTHLRQYPDRPPLIEFTAEVRDPVVTAESPGVIEFRLTNTTEMTLAVFSGEFPPFSLLRAEATDSSGGFLLWRDEFATMTEQEGEVVMDAVEVETPIEPTDTLTGAYSVAPATTAVSPGTYTVDYELWYRPREGTRKDPMPSEVVHCNVTFTVS